jgi:HEAT repeats
MESDQLLVNTYLERAIAEFDTNPLSAHLIRRMANELPDLFMVGALRYLDSADESSAHQFLTSMMLRHHSVFEEVADPSRGSCRRSVILFSRLLKIDLSFDVRLARKLPDRSGSNHAEAFDGPRSCRVLDVLNETSVGRRLLPILSHLVDSPNTEIAAEATLFVGRRIQSSVWAARQMMRGDPRSRANAVESIWGLNSPDAQALLEEFVGDQSNRVAGNALVGLYLLGKPGVVQQLTQMAAASAPVFRSTAAWAMGRIGGAAFIPLLTGLLRDDHPEVRSAALHSLLQMRRAEAALPEVVVTKETPGPEPVFDNPEPVFDIGIRLDESSYPARRNTVQVG